MNLDETLCQISDDNSLLGQGCEVSSAEQLLQNAAESFAWQLEALTKSKAIGLGPSLKGTLLDHVV